MFENLTPDGKIKTIRYLKATHEDFAKLVREGKKIIQDIDDMEKKTGITIAEAEKMVEEDSKKEVAIDGERKPVLWLYTYYVTTRLINFLWKRALMSYFSV